MATAGTIELADDLGVVAVQVPDSWTEIQTGSSFDWEGSEFSVISAWSGDAEDGAYDGSGVIVVAGPSSPGADDLTEAQRDWLSRRHEAWCSSTIGDLDLDAGKGHYGAHVGCGPTAASVTTFSLRADDRDLRGLVVVVPPDDLGIVAEVLGSLRTTDHPSPAA